MNPEGPYREKFDQKTEELERMRKQVEAEKKFGIQLSEEAEDYSTVPLFDSAIKQDIDPKNIVFYSLATGMMKFYSSFENMPFEFLKDSDSRRHGDADFKGTLYKYENNSFTSQIGVAYDKKTKKTRIFHLITHAKYEMERQESIKKFWRKEVAQLEKIITNLIGTNEVDKDRLKEHVPKLKELKTKFDNLIDNLEKPEK